MPIQLRQTPIFVQLAHLGSHWVHPTPSLKVSVEQVLQLLLTLFSFLDAGQSKHLEALSKQLLQSEVEQGRQLAPDLKFPVVQYSHNEPFRVPRTLHFVQVVALVVHSAQFALQGRQTSEAAGR